MTTSMEDTVARLYGAGNVVLAPMVRAGTLPFRLLCHFHGADAVYGEEIIAVKMAQCERVVNDALGTVEFRKDNTLVYATCAAERGRNVFQLGAADAVSAVRCATVVARDVASIDLNMGCPKHFSVHGGMGSALLSTPEVAADIISSLRRAVDVPVSCKIRLLESTSDTIELIRRLASAGAHAIAVHLRTRAMDRTRPALWQQLHDVVAASPVPVLINGDVWTRTDMAKLWETPVVAGGGGSQGGYAHSPHAVMVARGALRNPSIFYGSARRGALSWREGGDTAVGGHGSIHAHADDGDALPLGGGGYEGDGLYDALSLPTHLHGFKGLFDGLHFTRVHEHAILPCDDTYTPSSSTCSHPALDSLTQSLAHTAAMGGSAVGASASTHASGSVVLRRLCLYDAVRSGWRRSGAWAHGLDTTGGATGVSGVGGGLGAGLVGGGAVGGGVGGVGACVTDPVASGTDVWGLLRKHKVEWRRQMLDRAALGEVGGTVGGATTTSTTDKPPGGARGATSTPHSSGAGPQDMSGLGILEPADTDLPTNVRAYVRLCVALDNHISNTKYTSLLMLKENTVLGWGAAGRGGQGIGGELQRAKTTEDVLRAVGEWEWGRAWMQDVAVNRRRTRTDFVRAGAEAREWSMAGSGGGGGDSGGGGARAVGEESAVEARERGGRGFGDGGAEGERVHVAVTQGTALLPVYTHTDEYWQRVQEEEVQLRAQEEEEAVGGQGPGPVDDDAAAASVSVPHSTRARDGVDKTANGDAGTDGDVVDEQDVATSPPKRPRTARARRDEEE